MNILFPGRHHLLTTFQHEYLYRIIQEGLKAEPDVNGQPLGLEEKVDSVIFPVTSANHSNTRRNPLPFDQRAMELWDFSSDLGVPAYIYPVNDLLHSQDFADYTIKTVENRSEGQLKLTPANTVVLCSTPEVLSLYENLGFRILPAELTDRNLETYSVMRPWELVESLARLDDWRNDPLFLNKVHPATQRLWKTYSLGDKVKMLFNDRMIGDDGDLTDTRDYNSYVRQMDDIAELKYIDTAQYIRPGRIGDIGCAVGSWIKLASNDKRFRESDFFGVEISRQLYEICEQRKSNREFANPNIFFSRKNAVRGLVFDPNSMNTIHTSSLTHEIESYAGREDLLHFIKNRYDELATGGIWINRDVVGPKDRDETVYMKLNKEDGRLVEDDEVGKQFASREDLAKHLESLSTYSRFKRFALDFRHNEAYNLNYTTRQIDGDEYIELKLGDACEFMSKKDYTLNWQSEMHETFCHWSIDDWTDAMEDAGFKVLPDSKEYTNPWIADNRFKGKVELYRMQDSKLSQMEYPVTNMIMIGEKP